MEKIGIVPLSDSQMIRARDGKQTIAFALVNGQTVGGQVLWFDSFAYHVSTDQGELTIPRHAVLHYKAHA